MQTDLDPLRCPPEDTIECWAIQDVVGTPGNEERRHLIHCPVCHELHSCLVDFYRGLHDETHRNPVVGRPGVVNAPLIPEKENKRTSRILKPLNHFIDEANPSKPIALSHELLTGLGKGRWIRNSFISSDGRIIGKFVKLTDRSDWSFHLYSPDQRCISRSILHPADERFFTQSNDDGASLFRRRDRPPSEIQLMELIPFTAEARFDPDSFSCDTNLIIGSVEIDGGPIGDMIVEQEEGERGEPILHLLLKGRSAEFPGSRVFVALQADSFPPLVEEAIGRDIYFYGPDLFREFRLWVYLG